MQPVTGWYVLRNWRQPATRRERERERERNTYVFHNLYKIWIFFYCFEYMSLVMNASYNIFTLWHINCFCFFGGTSRAHTHVCDQMIFTLPPSVIYEFVHLSVELVSGVFHGDVWVCGEEQIQQHIFFIHYYHWCNLGIDQGLDIYIYSCGRKIWFAFRLVYAWLVLGYLFNSLYTRALGFSKKASMADL